MDDYQKNTHYCSNPGCNRIIDPLSAKFDADGNYYCWDCWTDYICDQFDDDISDMEYKG